MLSVKTKRVVRKQHSSPMAPYVGRGQVINLTSFQVNFNQIQTANTPVTAVQRTQLDATNAAEILLTGKKCNFNISFILMEI